MTDNEIMKALECCNRNGSCSKCPYDYDRARFEAEADCALEMTADVLDLINRLKVENEDLEIKLKHFAEFLAEAEKKNEELKAENEEVRKDIVTAEEYAWKLKAKNEALQMDNEQLKSDIINERMNLEHITYEFDLLKQEISVIEANAIKEFAERLKVDFAVYTDCGEHNCIYTRKVIDNLVEEMVGDSE